MVKEKEDKKVSDSLVEEEVKKVSKNKKKMKKKVKKEKKEPIKKEKKISKKKKRKFKVLNILIIFISLIFIIAGVIALLYGVGVIDFELADPGPNYYELSEKAKIGDYVNYDAGIWEEEKIVPNYQTPYTFGGYNKDLSRNKGIACKNNEKTNDGWRVFDITDDVVTLIHSGISMCYYHGYGNGTNDTSVNVLKNLNENNNYNYYLDNKYGESVNVLSKEDIDKFISGDSSYARIRDNLINVGEPYWLATKSGSYYMWYVTEGGSVAIDHVGAYGVRVLVKLKKNTKTTGIDKSGNWILATEIKKESKN